VAFGKSHPDDTALAEKFFQQAVDLDLNFADGYCGLAMTQVHGALNFGCPALADVQNSAEPLARLAVALDGANATAHTSLSGALFIRGDHCGALAEAETALVLSPNLASGYWARGRTEIFCGQPQEGLKDLQTSLRLEPRGSGLAPRLLHVSVEHYLSRSYDNAVEAARGLIRYFPEFPAAYRNLAAALGQLGHFAQAKETLDKAITLAPAAFDMYVRNRVPWHRPQDHAHLLDGLRKAGWRE
jgi:adenylate cyclase